MKKSNRKRIPFSADGFSVKDARGHRVAYCRFRSDAKLLAAAPELLAALIKLTHELSVNYLEYMTAGPSLDAGAKMVEEALAAIDKVR